MSETHLSLQPAPSLDHSILDFLDKIRKDVAHLLRPDQSATPENLSRGLDALKTGIETAWKLAEKGRMEAETKKIDAETGRIKAEKERIRVEVDKINAEIERTQAERRG